MGSRTRRLEVTPIDPTRDAPAFDAAQVDAIADGGHAPTRAQAIASLTPTCTVARGSVFVFSDADVRWGWARVRCGARVASVPVEHALQSYVVEERAGGAARLYQMIDVACDMANTDVWNFRATAAPRFPTSRRRSARVVADARSGSPVHTRE
jgi:hypothetical protein